MLVNNDISKKPEFGNSDYFSFNNTIKIEKGDGYFKPNGSYVISIKPIVFFFEEVEKYTIYEYNLLVDTNNEILIQ